MENKDLEKVINKWFEMKYRTYDKLEHDDSIYFYYEGEKYAEFRINKKIKNIYYKWDLYKEFSEIIPLKDIEFEEFINKWVEDTFGLMGFTPTPAAVYRFHVLKIPLV